MFKTKSGRHLSNKVILGRDDMALWSGPGPLVKG